MSKKPIIAICYDFDKTLTPTDMQAQGFIQECNIDVKSFWDKSNNRAKEFEMDPNLSWMHSMIEEAEANVIITKNNLKEYGQRIKLYKGLDNWFVRINKFGEERGVTIEHYVISSGLKEMIEGSSIAGEFKKIYASSFYYKNSGIVLWPAQVVNYTNKTQFLFRIKKGILNINDDTVNNYCPEEEERVPFRNMVYIGDSDTDIPCMELVRSNGGHSIGVYGDDDDKTKVYKILNEKRITAFVKADYSENTELDELIKNIICKVSYDEKIRDKRKENINDFKEYKENTDEDNRMKNELINQLESSSSFLMTHSIIKQLKQLKNFNEKQVIRLCKIALLNSQISSIIMDSDIKLFYHSLIGNSNCPNDSFCQNVLDKIIE